MIRERRIISSDQVETTKIAVDGAITTEEIALLKAEYGEVLEHYIVLYHPPVPQEEAARLREVVAELKKIDLSTVAKADLITALAKLNPPTREEIISR